MGYPTGTVKCVLFLFNTLWAILGILVLLFAGFGWGAMPQSFAIASIIFGSAMLIISLLGCLGAMRESACMLLMYAIFLVMLQILIVTSICLNKHDGFQKYAIQSVEDTWSEELLHPGAMNNTQKTYLCCGRNEADDYIKIGRIPPPSCCKESNCINPLNLYITGCLEKVEKAFSDEEKLSKYFEWGLLIFSLIVLILAITLAKYIMTRKRRYNY